MTEEVRQGKRQGFTARKMVVMAMLVAVCAVCAQIAIPMPLNLVPFTMQTLAIMVIAMMLPPQWAVATILTYVAAGSVGLPVFAQAKAGIGALLGPTGGFLWGFLPGVLLISWLAGKNKFTWGRGIIAALVGMVIIYAIGVWQLSLVAGLSWKQAFVTGALPFLPMEVIKIVLAVKIAMLARKRKMLPF